MNYKQWVFPNVDKQMVSAIADDCGIDPLLVFIAVSRGLTDLYDIERFFDKEPDFCDPYEYSGISEAVDRINIALESEEKILVFGDYDCDGVTATALLTDYLKKRGADVSFFVPDRENDGYGISVLAVEKAASDGVTLIITVDNGINAIMEAERANELGVDIIVTDHHLPQAEFPDVVALIDPHIDGDYVFRELCGVGVAFKLVCALEGRPCEELIYEYGDLVALGTIADIVPLHSENRNIVNIGLQLINRRLRYGIRALLEVVGSKYATSQSVAFTLCPRINAAGRMASADIAVKLLMSNNYDDALYYAGLLDNYNTNRQAAEQKIFDEACDLICQNKYNYDRVIVVDGKDWHIGVIGIAASKLTEKFGKPTIVISAEGERSIGSGRSVAGFSLFNALSECSDILTKFGGHELAAGLTVDEKNIPVLRKMLNNYADKMDRVLPNLNIDCRIKPHAFTLDTAKALKAFEPYGAANPMPLFATCDCTVLAINSIGQGKHIRLKLRKESTEFWAVMFGVSVDSFPYKIGCVVDVAVTLDVNTYNDTESVSVIVKAIRKSGVDETSFISQLNALEKYQKDDLDKASAVIICPEREDFVTIFKFLKANPMSKLDLIESELCSLVPIGKISVILDALCELQIVTENNGIYSLLHYSGKADLLSAPTIKKIMSYLGGE